MLATDVILYNGLSKNREIKIQEVALASIHSLLQLSLAEVKLESTKLFYTLIRHTHYKDLVEKEIKQDNKQLAEINSLYKNGTILKSDVLRSEVTLSNHQMLLTEIENNILIIQQQLNLLMGRDELAPLTPLYKDLKEEINLESSYESYLEKALQNAYELQIADNDIQRSELDLKQLQAKILPKVSLFADYSFNYPQSKAYPYADALYGMGQIGLKLNIPISNLYHTKHQKISQQSFISKQKVEREQKVDQLKNELRASYVKYTETLQRISVAEKNIKQTTETLRIIRNSYFNQQSLLTDLLDAETQLLQAQFDLTTAEINAKIEYYQIQKVIGNL
ncbi:outer membrane component of tripartite multidrug resistance system [Myroides odoratimimus]|nr:outer membrane component of tripartite multidrug resistance system [Myroides odoratimimus]